MNVINNLFRSYQATPQNDFPLETLSSVAGTSGLHDNRSNPLNEAPILAACRVGNLSWVRDLLVSDPQLANQTALSGNTGNKVYPLYIAAQEGHIDVVKYLTAVFIETLQTLPEADRDSQIRSMITAPCKGATPIFTAAEHGHINVVEYLVAVFSNTLQTLPEVDRNTEIRSMITAPFKDATTVFIAAQKGYNNVVKYLINVFIETLQTLPEPDRNTEIRAMIRAHNENEATSVFIAAYNGHVKIVNCLISVFIETLQTLPQTHRDTEIRTMITAPCKDATPVFIAAREGHINVVKYLIAVFIETLQALPEADRDTEIRAMLTAPCKDARATPLFIAAREGHINVVKYLFAVFIETLKTMPEETDRETAIRAMVTAHCKDGTTSVFTAAQNGYGEVVNWLLEHGADPEKRRVMCFLGKYRICIPLYTKAPLEVAIENKHIFIAARINIAIRERKASILVEERGAQYPQQRYQSECRCC